jgi:hypothetical protein
VRGGLLHEQGPHGAGKHDIGTSGTKQEAALAHDRMARQCGKDERLNYERGR